GTDLQLLPLLSLRLKDLVRRPQDLPLNVPSFSQARKRGLVVSMRSVASTTCALFALAAPTVASGSGSSSLLHAAAGSWTATASMSVARANVTATRLANGRVLVRSEEHTSELQ